MAASAAGSVVPSLAPSVVVPSSLATSAAASSFGAASVSGASSTFRSASDGFSVPSAASCARALSGGQRRAAHLTDVWSEWARAVRTAWDRDV